MQYLEKKIAIIGAGNMSQAFLKGLVNSNLFNPKNISVTCRNVALRRQQIPPSLAAVNPVEENRNHFRTADIFVLCVKPQFFEDVLQQVNEEFGRRDQIVISLIAGLTCTKLKRLNLHETAEIVRVALNTPAAVSQGCAGVYSSNLSTENKALTRAMLESFCPVTQFFLKEGDLDVVTGLCGSGPAFIFTLCEALSDAGVREGLSRDCANVLAKQMIKGAGALLKDSDKSASELREAVSSPAGTTIDGLIQLEKYNFRFAATEAVRAAVEKSRRLS